MKNTFIISLGAEISQMALWVLYKEAFTEYPDYPLLQATQLILNAIHQFPQAIVHARPSGYVLENIRIRNVEQFERLQGRNGTKQLAMERALRIPEILSEIFGFCVKDSLAVCGRTCRGWEQSAFRQLWSDLDDLTPLFSLLGELVTEDNHSYSVSHIVYKIIVMMFMSFFRHCAPLVLRTLGQDSSFMLP